MLCKCCACVKHQVITSHTCSTKPSLMSPLIFLQAPKAQWIGCCHSIPSQRRGASLWLCSHDGDNVDYPTTCSALSWKEIQVRPINIILKWTKTNEGVTGIDLIFLINVRSSILSSSPSSLDWFRECGMRVVWCGFTKCYSVGFKFVPPDRHLKIRLSYHKQRKRCSRCFTFWPIFTILHTICYQFAAVTARRCTSITWRK